jgi:outer membrane murein-binding lipoprotein Lpp
MVEVVAALAGAALTLAGMGAFGFTRKSDEARETLIRLATSVDHIASTVETLHSDIKEDRKETFARLSTVEQRVSKLEAKT